MQIRPPTLKKAAIFSDIHFGKSKDNPLILKSQLNYINWLSDKCTENKVDTIIFCGDWFDNRSEISVETLNAAYNVVTSLSQKFDIVFIIGNHDTALKNTNHINSIKYYEQIKNVWVYDKEYTQSVGYNKMLLFAPWNTDINKHDNITFAFGHFDYAGAALYKSTHNKGNYSLSDILKKFKYSFSGHFHICKDYSSNENKFFNVGSPIELDWGDYENEKYLYIIDFYSEEITKIKNTISPTHRRYFWSLLMSKKQLLSKRDVEGNYVELVIDDKYDFNTVRKVIDVISSCNPIEKCHVDYTYNNIKEIINTKTDDQDSNVKLDKIDYITKYINSIDNDKVDSITKKSVIECMQNYYQQTSDASQQNITSNDKIVFQSIYISNFLSIGKEPIFFDYTKHSGINCIYGINNDIPGTRNGSGKSTIFTDAILYALFGKTYKSVPNKYIHNRRVGKKEDTKVTVNFSIGKNNYLVCAGMRNKISYLDVYENDFEKSINKDSIENTRKHLVENILKIDYKLFKNSIVLSAAEDNNLFSMKASQKREFIESIFNLSVFGDMLQLIRKDNNINNNEIILKNSKVKQLETVIEDLTTKYNNCVEKNKSLISDINTDISMYEEKIKQQQLIIDSSNNQIQLLNNSLKDLDITNIKTNKQKLNDIESLLITSINSSEIRKQTHENLISNSLDKIKDIENDLCKNCIDTINTKFNIDDYRNIVKDETNKIKSYIEKKNLIIDKKTILDQSIERYNNLNQELTKHNSIINDSNLKITTYKNSIDQTKSLKDKITNDESEYVKLIDDYKKNIQTINDQIKILSDKKVIFDLCEYIVSEDGVKRIIICDLVKLLNNRIQQYLIETGANYTIQFSDNLECEFITESGDCCYENFSAGEKKRLNISVLFAFRDILINLCGIQSSILVFDEFIDSAIDEYAINAIIKLFKRYVEENKQTIYIITHRESINDEDINNIIEVVKENDVSKIIRDNQGVCNEV